MVSTEVSTTTTTTTEKSISTTEIPTTDDSTPPIPPQTSPPTRLKCIELEQSGITWPETRGGSEVRRDCPGNSRGFARWRCTKPGQWARDGPDLSDCRPKSSPAQENLPMEIAEKFKETDLAGVL